MPPLPLLPLHLFTPLITIRSTSDTHKSTCSLWKCWTYSQKAGTIAAIVFFVLGLLILLQWHLQNRHTRRKQIRFEDPFAISSPKQSNNPRRNKKNQKTKDKKKSKAWLWGLLAGWFVGSARRDRKRRQKQRRRPTRQYRRKERRGLSRSGNSWSSSLKSPARSPSRSGRRNPPMTTSPSPPRNRRIASAPLPYGSKAFIPQPRQKLPQINIIPPAAPPPAVKVRTRAVTESAALLGVPKMVDPGRRGDGRRREERDSSDGWRRGRLARWDRERPMEEQLRRVRSPVPPSIQKPRAITPSPSPPRRRSRSKKKSKKHGKRDKSPSIWRNAKWFAIFGLTAELVLAFMEPKGGWGQYHKKKDNDEHDHENPRRRSAESTRRQHHRERARGRSRSWDRYSLEEDSLNENHFDDEERNIGMRRMKRVHYSDERADRHEDSDGSTLDSSLDERNVHTASTRATVGRRQGGRSGGGSGGRLGRR